MACPYFFPTERLTSEPWPHPARLPLGGGWRGRCAAAERLPGDDELRDFCNLGYATGCPHLPADREADSVRFGVSSDNAGQVSVTWVRERAHRPVSHGTLQYDCTRAAWTSVHPDACVQRLAECYLHSYLSCHRR